MTKRLDGIFNCFNAEIKEAINSGDSGKLSAILQSDENKSLVLTYLLINNNLNLFKNLVNILGVDKIKNTFLLHDLCNKDNVKKLQILKDVGFDFSVGGNILLFKAMFSDKVQEKTIDFLLKEIKFCTLEDITTDKIFIITNNLDGQINLDFESKNKNDNLRNKTLNILCKLLEILPKEYQEHYLKTTKIKNDEIKKKIEKDVFQRLIGDIVVAKAIKNKI